MSRLMQQVRWFVRMLDKRNVEQTRFKPANEPVETGFSLRIILNYYILLFVLIMLQVSEKTPWKSLTLHPKTL